MATMDGEKDLFAVYIPTNHVYVGDIVMLAGKDIMRTNLSVREGIEIVVSVGMAVPPKLMLQTARWIAILMSCVYILWCYMCFFGYKCTLLGLIIWWGCNFKQEKIKHRRGMNDKKELGIFFLRRCYFRGCACTEYLSKGLYSSRSPLSHILLHRWRGFKFVAGKKGGIPKQRQPEPNAMASKAWPWRFGLHSLLINSLQNGWHSGSAEGHLCR